MPFIDEAESKDPRHDRSKSRRLKAYRFSACILMQLGQPEVWTRVTKNGVPEDAKVVAVDFDSLRQCFVAFVESEAFEEIGDIAQVPEAPEPLFTAIHRCRPSLDAERLSDEDREHLATEWECLQWGPLAGRVELLVDGLKWSGESDEYGVD